LKRRVIEELRPTLLDNLGLVAAIRWQCEETCSQANLTLEADFPEEELKVNLDIAIAIFRVAQESLTNIVKHARATVVKVSLRGTNEELVLTVEDNGIGLNNTTRKPSGSHGLLSMKYRMQTIGGTFQIMPVFPHGTRTVVWLGTDLANKLATLE
jgi:signal transduction histidine kinase